MTLAITCGDPAGVGPRVAVEAARVIASEGDRALLFGDGAQLASLLGGDVEGLTIRDVGRLHESTIAAHAPTVEGGALQLAALDAAIDAVKRGEARAIVTAPTSKAAIALSGHAFVGQTEHLARRTGLADDEVTMMFLGPRLKTALVTTHLAIHDVPGQITMARVRRAAQHLAEAILRLGTVPGARIAVTGLNPHAGERGMFGDEDAHTIAPAIEALRGHAPFVHSALAIEGPIGAETAFRWAASGEIAGVVAMFHDQATIASKLLDWGSAVNVTWGLPFVRTSVDHGVAYDAARRGVAEADGMIAAAQLARALVPAR